MIAPLDIDWLIAELNILQNRFERNAVAARTLHQDLVRDATKVMELKAMIEERASQDNT